MPKPGSPEWHARIASVQAEEMKQPIEWWYLSFAEPGQWKGGVITQARGILSAVDKASIQGINPGGEVQATRLGPELPPGTPLEAVDRLLTMEDMERWFGGAEKC